MADSVEYVIDGPDVAAGLSKFQASLGDLGETETAAAKVIAAAVRPLIPRRTGHLAAALTLSGGEVKVTGVRYAGPIEFGVGPRSGQLGPHNISPASFMERGTAQSVQQVSRLFENELDDELDKVGKVY